MPAKAVNPATRATVAIVNPDTLHDPAPNGYSHAVTVTCPVTCPVTSTVTGAMKLAFIAGQGGEMPDGALPAGFDAQVAQAYDNLLAVIDALGARPQDVVKLTTYPVAYDESKLAPMTQHLWKAFGDHLPAQTLVPVPRLALDGMLFEVDAVVALPG